MTAQTLRLIGVFLADPDAERYGLQIANDAGLKSGSVYVVLARLEEAGWLSSRWEDVDPVAEGRPRRRLYRLTRDGERIGREALEAHLAALTGGLAARPAMPRPGGIATT